MATIRVLAGRRGKTFQVVIRRKGHKPISKTFGDKKVAVIWARQTESAIERGEVLPARDADRYTLRDVVEKFLRERPDLTKDPISALRWWRDNHGERRLSAITATWAADVRETLLGEPVKCERDGRLYRRGAGQANRRVVYLAAALGKGTRTKRSGAMAWGWIQVNPLALVGKVPEPPGRDRYLSDDERRSLLEACRGHPDRQMYPLVACALSSGARAGELLSLRWRDLDLVRGVGVIRTSKTGDARTLHFVGLSLTALKDYTKVRPADPAALVFASDPSGRYPYRYIESFRAVCNDVGLNGFHFHDLRHSAASMLAQAGASLFEIGQVLGHKSESTTRRYAHLAQNHSGDLVKRVMGAKLA